MSTVLVAVALIVGGLAMCWGSQFTRGGLLASVVYWCGIGVTVLGLVLLITPVLVYVFNHVKAAFGV